MMAEIELGDPIFNFKANIASYGKGFEGKQTFMFSEEETEKALEIIKLLDGMTISRAHGLLDSVKKILLTQVISL